MKAITYFGGPRDGHSTMLPPDISAREVRDTIIEVYRARRLDDEEFEAELHGIYEIKAHPITGRPTFCWQQAP